MPAPDADLLVLAGQMVVTLEVVGLREKERKKITKVANFKKTNLTKNKTCLNVPLRLSENVLRAPAGGEVGEVARILGHLMEFKLVVI